MGKLWKREASSRGKTKRSTVLGPRVIRVTAACAKIKALMDVGIGAGVICRATAKDELGVPCRRQQVDALKLLLAVFEGEMVKHG